MRLLQVAFIIILLALACVSTSSYALSANVSANRYKYSDTSSILEIEIAIDAFSVMFVKNEGGKFLGKVACEVSLSDADGVKFFDKFNMVSPEVDDTTKRGFTFNVLKRIELQHRPYELKIDLKDPNGRDTTYTVKTTLDGTIDKEILAFGDIMFLSDFTKAESPNDYTKHGYQLTNYMSSFYPASQTTMKYFTELYNTGKVLRGEDVFLVFFGVEDFESGIKVKNVGRYTKLKPQDVQVLLGEINIENVKSGNYNFVIEVRSKTNDLLSVTKKYFQRSNGEAEVPEKHTDTDVQGTFAADIKKEKLNFYLSSLYPLADQQENDMIETLSASGDTIQKRQYLYHFWFKRHKEFAQGYWKDYKERVNYVHKKFGCGRYSGIKSEMGRVYLKYGKPNRVDDQYSDPGRNVGDRPNAFQIWYFYNIANQSNRVFVFQQQNLGNCNFQMIHSDVKGETFNPDWMGTTNWKDRLRKHNTSNPIESIYDEDLYNR